MGLEGARHGDGLLNILKGCFKFRDREECSDGHLQVFAESGTCWCEAGRVSQAVSVCGKPVATTYSEKSGDTPLAALDPSFATHKLPLAA
ncbi:MAG: hypothetical protein Tsb0019_24180 [Roseibium sp.]